MELGLVKAPPNSPRFSSYQDSVIFLKFSLGCCNSYINFQRSEKVDFDSFCSIFLAFMEKHILGTPFPCPPALWFSSLGQYVVENTLYQFFILFLWLYKTPLCQCCTIYSNILLSMGISVVASILQLQTMLQWTSLYMYIFGLLEVHPQI